MLCDLHRYELSARGPMAEAASARGLADSILHLPHDSTAHLDLTGIAALDPAAADLVAEAIETQVRAGVEMTISVDDELTRWTLVRRGLHTLIAGGSAA